MCTGWGAWWGAFAWVRGLLVLCNSGPVTNLSACSPLTVPAHPELFTAMPWKPHHDPAMYGVDAHGTHDQWLLHFDTPGFRVTLQLLEPGSAACCPVLEDSEVDCT